MHVCIFLIIVSYSSRLSTVSCVPRAANRQTCQWNPNLIFYTQKAFASSDFAHSPYSPTSNVQHRNINWRVFKNQWRVPNVKCVWYYEVMSHISRLQGIGDSQCFPSLSLRVPSRTFNHQKLAVCLCLGASLKAGTGSEDTWRILSRNQRKSGLLTHIWMWRGALMSETTKPSA